MDELKVLTEAIRFQTNTITNISTAGIGATLLVLGSIMGMRDDIRLAMYRWPLAMLLPLICFVLAVVLGYLINGALAGLWVEIVQGHVSGTSGKVKITDYQQYFVNEYKTRLQMMGLLQLLASVAGVVTIAGWFAVNALKLWRKGAMLEKRAAAGAKRPPSRPRNASGNPRQ